MIEIYDCTDFDTQRTFRITVSNGIEVIHLEENGEEIPKDSEWWDIWQGKADSGAFEIPDDYNEPIR